MELLRFLFNIGIIFIVLSLIWGFFMIIMRMLAQGERKGVFEENLLKSVNYYILASLTAMAAHGASLESESPLVYTIAGLVMLYLYMVGKQERQQFKMMFRAAGGQFNLGQAKQNKTLNTIYLLGTLSLYAISVVKPEIAFNGLNLWFMNAIVDIQDTVLIGWIIKIVGVFFLINIIFRGIVQTQKLVNGLNNPLEPKAPFEETPPSSNDDDFDDYEIVE